jgi:iron(III) transport system permease protein
VLDYAAAAPYAAALVLLSAPLTHLLLHSTNEEPLT